MNRARIPTDPVGRAGFFVFLGLALTVLTVLVSGAFGDNGSSENNTLFTVAGATLPEADPVPPQAPTVVPTVLPTLIPTTVPVASTAVPTAVPAATAEPTPAATETATPEATETATPETATPEPTETATPEPTEPTPEPPPAQAVSSSFVHTLRATGDVDIASIYDSPDGEPQQITYTYLDGTVVQNDIKNPTHFGNPLVFRVLEGQPGDAWAKVMVPTRPNGQVGWIQTDLYDWGSSNYLIQIDVGTNRVAVFEGDELVLETAAVTGTDSSPTPILTAYVDEKVSGLSAPYGPVLLSLGVFSNALNTFGANGEVPKIALHGTNRPELMGEYQSNGCIRIENDVITRIADLVPIGTKVEIVRT